MLKLSKYSKIALPLALVSTLAFSQEEKKDWRQKLQEGMNKAKETTQEYKEKANDSYQRYKQETSERFREGQQQYQQGMQNLSQSTKDYTYQLRQSDLGRLVEQNARDMVSNPSKVYEIKRNMEHYALNSTVSAVKKLPVYDPADGKVKTYDQFIRENLDAMNIDLPPALEEDPTKAMIFMSLDSDYLFNAKLIKSGNNWLSLREMTSSNPNETARDAYTSYMRMKDALRSSDRDLANSYMQGFVTNISKLNQQTVNFDAKESGLTGFTHGPGLTGLTDILKDNFLYHGIDNLTSMVRGSALEHEDRAPFNFTIMGLLSLLGIYTAAKIAKSRTRSDERKTKEMPTNKFSAVKEKLVLDPKTNQFVNVEVKQKDFSRDYNPEDLNLEDVVEED